MHGRAVERVLAVVDPQKAGGLLERLGAEPRHFAQRLPAAEGALLVAVTDDRTGERLREPRDAREQGR